MRSKSPILYMRVRELGGWDRLRRTEGRGFRLYAMTYAPRYELKTAASTRRTTHSVKDWAPYV